MSPPPSFFGFPDVDANGRIPFPCHALQPAIPRVKGPPRQKFTVQEDEQLRELVIELGVNNWSEVAARLGTRSARQCRERFKNYLSPNLRNGQWTEEEDQLLAEKFAQFGAKWSVIVAFFPSRSEVNLKNRWTQLTNRGAFDIEQEKLKVIQQLDSVIAGTTSSGQGVTEQEEELDPLDWDYSDANQGIFNFLRSGFDDSPFP
jgi:hypothetical protein